jgi:phage tail-like protein
MEMLGIRYDPYMSFNFLVEIDGLLTGGFTEVSGLESELELEEYAEGGMNKFTYQFPKRVKYPNLVLSYGLTDVDTMVDWYEDASKGKIKRKNGTIILLNRNRIPVMSWDFKKAYPVKWVGPELNASNGTEVAVEKIELVHQGIDI